MPVGCRCGPACSAKAVWGGAGEEHAGRPCQRPKAGGTSWAAIRMVVQSISWGGAGHGLVASTAHRVATQAGTPGSARTPRPRPRAPHAGGDVQRERAPAAASAGPAPMAGRGRGRGHCGGRIPGVRAAQRVQRSHGCASAARVGSIPTLSRSRSACQSARPKWSWVRACGPGPDGRTPTRLSHVWQPSWGRISVLRSPRRGYPLRAASAASGRLRSSAARPRVSRSPSGAGLDQAAAPRLPAARRPVVTGASPAGAACWISTRSITSRVRVTCAGGWRVGHLAHAWPRA